jgi:hypothetical protein
MLAGLHVKYILFLSDFNQIWIFSNTWKDWHVKEEESYQKWNDWPRIGKNIENGFWNRRLTAEGNEEEEDAEEEYFFFGRF